MATLSNADTILDGDRLRVVRVVLEVTVNLDAYQREYGDTIRVSDIKDDVRQSVLGMVEDGPNLFPEGILHDVELVR